MTTALEAVAQANAFTAYEAAALQLSAAAATSETGAFTNLHPVLEDLNKTYLRVQT